MASLLLRNLDFALANIVAATLRLKSLHLGAGSGHGVCGSNNRRHVLGNEEGVNAIAKHTTTLVLVRLKL
jgi:hypothetical protein